MFCRWSPTFLIFCWLVIMMMMMEDGDDYDDDDGEDGQCHVHILNSGAFSLVLVEKSFLAIFSANQKVRMVGFFSWTVLYEGHNLFLKYPASKFQLSR